jgi:uncharacterized protein YhaN
MKINRLEIKNFKKFSDYTLELHPQFTLLIGDRDPEITRAQTLIKFLEGKE